MFGRTIKAAFGYCANASTARSSSAASVTAARVTCTTILFF